MTEKYVEKVVTKTGIKWGVYPKKDVRDATGYSGERFSREEDANRYSRQIQEAYRAHKDALRESIHIETHTVDYLIAYYYTTSEFKERLVGTSKEHYRIALRTASEIVLENNTKPFGSYYFNRVTAEMADKVYLSIKKTFSAHRAAMCMKALRRVWYVCARHGRTPIDKNPFKKMGIPSQPSRTIRWTPEQIDHFIATADEMGPKYSAVSTLVLMCYELCQRPVDMRKIGWDKLHYPNGDKYPTFVFTQQKTNTAVSIPCSDMLGERLNNVPKSNEHNEIVINPATGKPFDRRLYNKYAALIRKKAELPDQLKVGDLRRTGATEMAHSGCTDDEMRAVTGHKSRDVLSIYIIPTAAMASTAMQKRRREAF